MADQTIKAFKATPRHFSKTLTVDNGKEFAEFKRIQLKTGLAVYFADPYSAWQRGTNENTNGLLRWYFPKGTDFSNDTKKTDCFCCSKSSIIDQENALAIGPNRALVSHLDL